MPPNDTRKKNGCRRWVRSGRNVLLMCTFHKKYETIAVRCRQSGIYELCVIRDKYFHRAYLGFYITFK